MAQDVIGAYYDRLIRNQYLTPAVSKQAGSHYRICRGCGSGNMRRVRLGDGLDVNYCDDFSVSLRLTNEEILPDMLEISCCLRGTLRVGLDSPAESYSLQPGQVMFYYHKNSLPAYAVDAYGYGGFSLHVHHDYLARWLAPDCAAQLDETWRLRVARLFGRQRLLVAAAPLDLLQLADGIQAGPGEGISGYLAFQAKVLDVLGSSLRLLDRPQTPPLPPQDWQLANQARQYLQENLCQPPAIAELARILHTNSCKLKKSFKQAYQTTLYGYVKRLRLEKSRELLKDPALSIAAVASEIGYANPSKYAVAFKLYTGMTPREYKQNLACAKSV
ncbi:MAG: AraC family transcriptional regulator [Sporomusaceae bacterium]|nr:AraC family transcriptional regulator [Sporomusaceae bacterium]